MRLRHKPWAKEKLAAHPEYIIQADGDYKGNWTQQFAKDQPIHIEVGMGKGQFIIEMAKAHPEINYVGIELQDSVIVMALETVLEEELDLPNLKLFPMHGGDLVDHFAKGEVSRIYLNFSDPWPKARHAKRRLTHERFLSVYQEVIKEDGDLHFKTDNQGLFEYSLISFSEYGMILKYISLNLHETDFHKEENIMTEYEEKFSQRGQRIYRLEADFPEKK